MRRTSRLAVASRSGIPLQDIGGLLGCGIGVDQNLDLAQSEVKLPSFRDYLQPKPRLAAVKRIVPEHRRLDQSHHLVVWSTLQQLVRNGQQVRTASSASASSLRDYPQPKKTATCYQSNAVRKNTLDSSALFGTLSHRTNGVVLQRGFLSISQSAAYGQASYCRGRGRTPAHR